ncbi:ATPase associated with various cellular activities AAA_5 [Pyrolobus fumarii 1A]|uniref:ATPase associated with various cellular activities AAA_5 n=1 Tax=Pyrolobus fumarii (strain DSM 11204 / 1A) TaxID=694429 RepID=G0EHL4_PYRF1|nr:AAA family ATPase [Pyrolobus fumarii]AEM39367.1 ATPase associated with various cellular activities AAA_5 [Pyrolobus fumarii 1A]
MVKQDVIKTVRRFYEELAAPFVGREEEARAITLALLAREHVILIGEPGTAKSALARRAAQLLKARFFKYLLTRYTEPSELFGPLDIAALKEGKYVRITKGKLPEAEIVFLDEVFNANSAILNALLSIMQERVWYDGYTEIRVPLWTLVGASNRVPDEPELEAVYDRFLVRQYTRPLPENKWGELLDAAWMIESGKLPEPKPVMSMEDLMEAHKLVFQVDLEPIKQKLLRLIAVFEERGIHLTDRRKGKALKLIAANAILEGRMVAQETDLLVLKYIAPKDIEDFDRVSIILSEELKTPEKYLKELNDIRMNIREAARLVDTLKSYDPRLVDLFRSLKVAKSKVIHIMKDTEDQAVRALAQQIISEIDELLSKVSYKLHM